MLHAVLCWRQVAHIMRAVVRFIAQCHAKGLIYRDIKPGGCSGRVWAWIWGIHAWAICGLLLRFLQPLTHAASLPLPLASETRQPYYAPPWLLWRFCAFCSPPHPSTPAPADATMTATVAP